MDRTDIEHMAQGFPPSHIGKDHEEVVIYLATALLEAQQKLDAAKSLAGIAGDLNGFVREGFESVVAQRDALAAENALIHSKPSLAAIMEALDAFYEHEDLPETGMLAAHKILLPKRLPLADTYLNSVRAEGVDYAVDELKNLAKRNEAEAPKSAENTHAAALYLMLFANQLRKGASQ